MDPSQRPLECALEAVADLIFAVSPNDETVDDADLLTVLFAFGQGCERAIHPCSERIHLWGRLWR